MSRGCKLLIYVLAALIPFNAAAAIGGATCAHAGDDVAHHGPGDMSVAGANTQAQTGPGHHHHPSHPPASDAPSVTQGCCNDCAAPCGSSGGSWHSSLTLAGGWDDLGGGDIAGPPAVRRTEPVPLPLDRPPI